MAARYAVSRSTPGRLYLVNETWCECPGFQFRGKCWHRQQYDAEAGMTEQLAPHTDIHAAINAVMQEVGYVQKNKTMGTGQYAYRYAGEQALIEALRPAMVEHGIYCHVNGITDVRHEELSTSKGGVMQRVTIVANVRFTHTPSGTFIDAWACGEGMDSGDKASNKAATGALKYALRQTFCIETGDDPDDSRPENDMTPRGNQASAANGAARPASASAPKDGGDPWQVVTAEMAASKGRISWAGLGPLMVGTFSKDALMGWLAAEPGRTPYMLIDLARAHIGATA